MIPVEAVEAAARILGDCEGTGANNWEWHTDNARAALEAAAPHMQRTITTVEELDALGRSATIMQPGGTVLVHDGQAEDPWASYVEDPFGGPVWANSSQVTLPVIVLHEGDRK